MVKWNREETLLNDGGLKKVPKDLPSEPGNHPTGMVTRFNLNLPLFTRSFKFNFVFYLRYSRAFIF